MPRIMLLDDERNVLSSLRRTILAMPSNTFDGAMTVETFDLPEQTVFGTCRRLRVRSGDLGLIHAVDNGITFLNELIQIQPTRWTSPIDVELNHALSMFDTMRSKLFGIRWWTSWESAKPSSELS